MNSEMEASLVKKIGLLSALFLVVLLLTISYFMVQNNQSLDVIVADSNIPDTPEITRGLNQADKALLYQAAELARDKEKNGAIDLDTTGMTEISPGVFSIDVYELTREHGGSLNEYGDLVYDEEEVDVDQIGLINK